MKKVIIPIVIGAFIVFALTAPNMTADTDVTDNSQAAGLEAQSVQRIPIPGTLLILGTGLVGLIAIRRKTGPNSK